MADPFWEHVWEQWAADAACDHSRRRKRARQRAAASGAAAAPEVSQAREALSVQAQSKPSQSKLSLSWGNELGNAKLVIPQLTPQLSSEAGCHQKLSKLGSPSSGMQSSA